MTQGIGPPQKPFNCICGGCGWSIHLARTEPLPPFCPKCKGKNIKDARMMDTSDRSTSIPYWECTSCTRQYYTKAKPDKCLYCDSTTFHDIGMARSIFENL